ncbi:hypothetical protein CW304_30090 [Bacillus sp. UFRGS-B20]|nr:hypothetical protein CW304_30090 [Bacillus sp. UFRGS-B20]
MFNFISGQLNRFLQFHYNLSTFTCFSVGTGTGHKSMPLMSAQPYSVAFSKSPLYTSLFNFTVVSPAFMPNK